MALFVDGTISAIEELEAHDTSVVRIASAENVDLDAKIDLAKTEIGIELEEFLVKRTTATRWGGAGVTLGDVVVTPPLKHWHALLTLTLVYGDIQSNHLKSRYEQKWRDYQRRAKWAANSLWRSGIGVVASPIPRPAPPSIRTAPGTVPIQTYWVRVAWQTATGETSEPSQVSIYTAEFDGMPAVTPADAPVEAVGYNVYVGLDANGLTRQNGAPLAVETEWVMPSSGLVDGEAPTDGQAPDRFVRNDRVLMRG